MGRTSGYESGDLPDAAVQVLIALGQPRHGYAVMTFWDEQEAHVQMGPATLYTTLKKLLAAGLIEEMADAGARRPYRRTPRGTAALVAAIDQRRQLVTLAERNLDLEQEQP